MSHKAEHIGFLISLCKHSLTAAIAEAYHGIILEEIEKRRPCHEPCLGNDERAADKRCASIRSTGTAAEPAGKRECSPASDADAA